MQMENRIGLGIAGCGNFSDSLAAAAAKSTSVELVSCYDLMAERRRKFAATYRCDQEPSYLDLVKRKDIQGVVIVTPNVEHAGQTLLAIEHGKHVFVEKPIANTLAEGKEMVAACHEAGRILSVGHLRRRCGGIRKAKELIDSGVIGEPVMVEATVSSDSGFHLSPDKFRWSGDDTGCPGGALMTSGIHHVDAFNYLLGPIQSVSAFFQKQHITADVEDINATICRFASGILGYLGATYASPYDNWMYVHGTQANLLWTVQPPVPPVGKFFHNQDPFTRILLFEKGKAPREVPFPYGDPVLEELDEFAACIRSGSPPETDGRLALSLLAYIRAAIDSANSGRQIELKAPL